MRPRYRSHAAGIFHRIGEEFQPVTGATVPGASAPLWLLNGTYKPLGMWHQPEYAAGGITDTGYVVKRSIGISRIIRLRAIMSGVAKNGYYLSPHSFRNI